MIIETRGRKPKLSPEQKREVLTSKMSVSDLAIKYSIAECNIYKIFKNRTKLTNG